MCAIVSPIRVPSPRSSGFRRGCGATPTSPASSTGCGATTRGSGKAIGRYERLCHDAGIPRFLLDFTDEQELRERLLEPRAERFICVVYRPDTERLSHYFDASLPRQFDAYAWFDQTTAVTPLGSQHSRAGVPETYPFGL